MFRSRWSVDFSLLVLLSACVCVCVCVCVCALLPAYRRTSIKFNQKRQVLSLKFQSWTSEDIKQELSKYTRAVPKWRRPSRAPQRNTSPTRWRRAGRGRLADWRVLCVWRSTDVPNCCRASTPSASPVWSLWLPLRLPPSPVLPAGPWCLCLRAASRSSRSAQVDRSSLVR